MESALVDQLLDECSQIRVLIVGSSRGKAALIREIFGVSRVLRYPAEISRDEEVYSDENPAFVAHIQDDWRDVASIIRRRNGTPVPGRTRTVDGRTIAATRYVTATGESPQADEVIHLIWHYVDAQDAVRLAHESEMQCPADVLACGVPIVTVFGRFDNIVHRAEQIGRLRRLKEPLSAEDEADGAHIRELCSAINLFRLQYPDNIAIASKDSASKLTFLRLSLSLLQKADVRTLLIIAQRLDPTVKFEASLSLAMRQFLLGTISTASPLPIPFAGLAGSSSATYLIKQDILRIWNIYDPWSLCGGTGEKSSMMENMLQIPVFGAKYLLKYIPVVAQIRGIWETPKMAKTLGSLMIDLMLLMERCFLANMGIETNSRIEYLAQLKPVVRRRSAGFDIERWGSPVSDEVRKNRNELMTGSREGTPVAAAPSREKDAPPPRPARPPKPPNLTGTPSPELGDMSTPPPKPARRQAPGSAPANVDAASPALPQRRPMTAKPSPSTPQVATPPQKPARPIARPRAPSQADELAEAMGTPMGDRSDPLNAANVPVTTDDDVLVLRSPSPIRSDMDDTPSHELASLSVSHDARKPVDPATPRMVDNADGKRPATLVNPSTDPPRSSGSGNGNRQGRGLTEDQLTRIYSLYKPVHAAVLDDLDEFFDLEGSGLKRSFQKNTVSRFLEGLLRKYRVTDVVEII
ncbi:hypothetical protein PYCC9005_004454 [Savitreella phatthalungensis]